MNIKEYIASGAIESVVMGLADPDEVAELEQLRRQYPEVETYAAQCEQWLHDTAMQQTVPVPDSARQAFLQAISSEESPGTNTASAPIVSLPQEKPVGRVVRLNSSRYAAIASVVLLIGSALLNFYLYREYSKAKQAYTELNNINLALASQNKDYQAQLTAMNRNTAITVSPDYVKVPMAGTTGKEDFSATVFWNKKTSEVFLIANNLPAAPAGKQYQLWALLDGKPVDAGVLGDCKYLCSAKNISQAQAFAITLENAGGSPQPDLQQLYVMGKIPV